MSTYKHINLEEIPESRIYSMDLYGKETNVVKVKTGRWVLTDDDGNVLFSRRSEGEILELAAFLEERRAYGNINGFRFGSKIDEAIVMSYSDYVWGNLFKLSNVNFDGHYWYGDITHTPTKETGKHLRLDYFINYMRVPEGMEHYEGVEGTKACA